MPGTARNARVPCPSPEDGPAGCILVRVGQQLTRRGEKKRQLVRTGYAGVGVGVLVLVIGLSIGSLIFDLLGVLIVLAAGWATRALRSL